MSRDKQIEEMAKDLAMSIVWDEDEIPTVNCYETAAFLSAKYRKASEVAREIFEEIERLLDKNIAKVNHADGSFTLVFKRTLEVDLAKLRKKNESEGADDD